MTIVKACFAFSMAFALLLVVAVPHLAGAQNGFPELSSDGVLFFQSTICSDAAFVLPPQNFAHFAGIIICLVSRLVGVLIALAFLFFLWGVSQFVLKADNEEGREKGKQILLWGVIVLFLLFAAWSIIQIIGTTFGSQSRILF